MPKRYGSEFGSSHSSLDLHGLRIKEAKDAVDSFLLEQVNAGNGLVKVIHGWGTGKMQREMQKYLQAHRDVKAVRPAPNPNEAAFLVELNLF